MAFGNFEPGRFGSQSLGALVGILVLYAIYGGWQQSQEIDASNRLLLSVERRVVSIDPGIYERYVGLYQLEPRFNINISYSDGRIYGQGTNQQRVELFPASATTFFNNITDALITFKSDANGNVSEFILRQPGRVRIGKRIALAAGT
jgi:hypothetical protein